MVYCGHFHIQKLLRLAPSARPDTFFLCPALSGRVMCGIIHLRARFTKGSEAFGQVF